MAKQKHKVAMRDDPAFSAAADKLADLNKQHLELEREVSILSSELSSMPRGGSPVDVEAEVFLAGGTLTATKSPVLLREEHRQKRRQLDVLSRAVDKQEKIVETCRLPAARKVGASFLVEHQALAKRIDNAAREIQEVHREELEMRMEIQRITQFYQTPGPMAPIVFAPLFTDIQNGLVHFTAVDLWRKRLKERGYLK